MDILNESAPGVYAFTNDQAQAIAAASPVVAAVVFESERGPVNEPQLIAGDIEKFIQMYGPPRPSVSLAHESIIEFLKTGAPLYALRVDNGSVFAGSSLFSTSNYNEGYENEDILSFFPNDTLARPTSGLKGEEALVNDLFMLEVIGTMTAGNIVIKYSAGNGAAEVTVTTAFDTDMPTTLAAFASDLETSLQLLDADITVELIAQTYDTATRYIKITSGEAESLPALFDFTATGAVVSINTQSKFFDVFAISPGPWGNRIGYRVRSVDYGRQTTKRVTLSGPLIANSTITLTVEGVVIGPVAFDTDHATTMENLKTALDAALSSRNILTKLGTQDWATAFNPDTVLPPNNLTFEIGFRHREYGEDFTLTAVTNGAGAPTATVETLVEPDDWTGMFNFEVFLRDDPTRVAESFRVTLHENVDDFGNQTNISYVVNEGPSASRYVRIKQPEYTLYEATDDSHLMRMSGIWADNSQTTLNVHQNIQWLEGGTVGAQVTTSQFLAGLEIFKDREKYPISLIMNAGYTNVSVQKKIAEVCAFRRDCFGVLDMPSERQSTSSAKEYSDFILGLDTSFCGLYTPDIRAESEYSPGGRFIPPSGDVCARIAERQRQISNVGAPAGLENGRIPRANKARVDYSQQEVGLLQESNINPIIRKSNNGFVIYGARTMQRRLSPLSFVPTRLDLSQIERQIVSDLDFSVFKANNDFTRFAIKQRIEALLNGYLRAGVLRFFEVVVDEQNNQIRHEAVGQLNVDVILSFVYPAEKIKLVTTLTQERITFQELQLA